MTKKEATNKLWLNLLIVTPLGTLLFASIIGWLTNLTLGIITAVLQVVFRVYVTLKVFNEDMNKINVSNHV